MQREYKYLIKVDDKKNQNKFFEIKKENNHLIVNSGRVGGKVRTQNYHVSKWQELYRSKILEGYEDMTKFHLIEMSSLDEADKQDEYNKYQPIEDKEVEKVVVYLLKAARDIIEENYLVGLRDVSPIMLEKASKIIAKLDRIANKIIKKEGNEELLIDDFNEYLQQLFSTLPRQMKDVKNNLLSESVNVGDIMEKETQLLDTFKTQYLLRGKDIHHEYNHTILEEMNLSMIPVTEEEFEKNIKPMLGDKGRMYCRAFKVCNPYTRENFDNWCEEKKVENKKLFWHGSTNNCWWSILTNGLSLDYARYGMFGKGLYFSNDADKSMGYSSNVGSRWANGNSNTSFMGIFETAYGKPVKTQDWDPKCGEFDADVFSQKYPANDCYHALRGSNLRKDEIIFYHNEQATIKYLVEFKN